MSNSPLIDYKKISPNKTSPRRHKIDTITIHCVVGQCSVESIGNMFAANSRKASSNYAIGSDGRIGLYVEEQDRSWCSSSSSNDNRAITIECASDKEHPYAINSAVYEALVTLCADICSRNGIKELKWKANKTLIGQIDKQNITVHRWFANKACPGDYIYNRLGQIASDVNSKIEGVSSTNPAQKLLYCVQTGAFGSKFYADTMLNRVKAAGFDTCMVKVNNLYKIQVGAYINKTNANAMAEKLKAAGFDTYIVTKNSLIV